MCILFFETFKIGHFQRRKSQHLSLFECFSVQTCAYQKHVWKWKSFMFQLPLEKQREKHEQEATPVPGQREDHDYADPEWVLCKDGSAIDSRDELWHRGGKATSLRSSWASVQWGKHTHTHTEHPPSPASSLCLGFSHPDKATAGSHHLLHPRKANTGSNNMVIKDEILWKMPLNWRLKDTIQLKWNCFSQGGLSDNWGEMLGLFLQMVGQIFSGCKTLTWAKHCQVCTS